MGTVKGAEKRGNSGEFFLRVRQPALEKRPTQERLWGRQILGLPEKHTLCTPSAQINFTAKTSLHSICKDNNIRSNMGGT